MKSLPFFNQIWSYSLYGDNFDLYYKPFFENISVADNNGAHIVINTNSLNYEKILNYFECYLDKISIICHEGDMARKYPKVLRFLVAEKINSNYIFFKDSDSLVNDKEIMVSRHWMAESAALAMIIRDHPEHVSPILAGMFAVQHDTGRWMASEVFKFFDRENQNLNLNDYSYDQDWLKDNIYPVIVKNSQVYSSFFYFVGEKLIKIQRNKNFDDHIGAQYLLKNKISTGGDWYRSIYSDKMLCIPFFRLVNKIFPRLVYGRVRPTLVLAKVYSLFFSVKTLNPA